MQKCQRKKSHKREISTQPVQRHLKSLCKLITRCFITVCAFVADSEAKKKEGNVTVNNSG